MLLQNPQFVVLVLICSGNFSSDHKDSPPTSLNLTKGYRVV